MSSPVIDHTAAAPATVRPVLKAEWHGLVADYRHASAWRASWQLINTLGPYGLLTYLLYISLGVSIWLTLGLMVLAAAFLVRLFIIFHDCAHGSFFGSKLLNDVVGMVAGTLTFTPYHQWRARHNVHHATSGDLDRRGAGDVWTLTVREYLACSRWKRCLYRIGRNPAVLFVAAPLLYFVVSQRFCRLSASWRERLSVYATDVAILAVAAALCALFGIRSYLEVQMGVMMLAGAAGLWLFYVQHQFEGVYWERGEDWDYASAALRGSSYYKLPAVLRWFSGSIGFHHIHHLSPRIPNYHLRRCHDAGELFSAVKPVTLLSSLKCLSLRLWDERRGQLVGFRRLQEMTEP
jgi:omega-6 fatty acid desaturase (delta-12 desaturase)